MSYAKIQIKLSYFSLDLRSSSNSDFEKSNQLRFSNGGMTG